MGISLNSNIPTATTYVSNASGASGASTSSGASASGTITATSSVTTTGTVAYTAQAPSTGTAGATTTTSGITNTNGVSTASGITATAAAVMGVRLDPSTVDALIAQRERLIITILDLQGTIETCQENIDIANNEIKDLEAKITEAENKGDTKTAQTLRASIQDYENMRAAQQSTLEKAQYKFNYYGGLAKIDKLEADIDSLRRYGCLPDDPNNQGFRTIGGTSTADASSSTSFPTLD